MQRATFLAGLTASTTLGPAAAPKATPSPQATGDDDAPNCDRNPLLPYDKRLEFREDALDGPAFDLAKYRGYAVWINVFATWCGPCRSEQPLVVATAKKYRAQGLRTIGLFSNEPDNAVRGYRKAYGIDYPIVRDFSGILTANLQGTRNGNAFPVHLFITGNGFLYCYERGGLEEESLASIIVPLLRTTAPQLPADPEASRPPAV